MFTISPTCLVIPGPASLIGSEPCSWFSFFRVAGSLPGTSTVSAAAALLAAADVG